MLGRSVAATGVVSAPSVLAVVRPEQVAVEEDGPSRVVSTSFLGPITRVTVQDPQAGTVVADIMSVDADWIRPGSSVRIRLRDDVERVLLIDGS